MEFKEFKLGMQVHLEKMLKDQLTLYVVDIDKEVLWNLYLDSFPPGTNDIYRKRREYDCGCCKQFIRAFGNVVAIKGNKTISIWDFTIEDPAFQTVANALSGFIHAANIDSVFVTKVRSFGTDKSHELVDGVANTWEHFYAIIPKQLVSKSTKSEGDLQGDARASKQVFKRSLDELSPGAVDTVLDLISQNTLYKGQEWEAVLQKFQELQTAYAKLSSKQKDVFCWRTSREHGGALTRIRNHSIGTLLVNISEGVELDTAVKAYEKIVAPNNYKRPNAFFSKRMVEDAQNTITALGLEPALHRRFTKISDVKVSDVLYVNRDVQKNMKDQTVFDTLIVQATAPIAKKRTLEKMEEVPIETFIKDILPGLTSIEVMLENKHEENLVSLISPKIEGSPVLFKWGNSHSWAYNGNLTDSMKENVKAAGGKVDGVLRFSIQWNDEHGTNLNDFDAHCFEPGGNHIYYGTRRKQHASSGDLDVDIIHPDRGAVAVENITYSSKKTMPNGIYEFSVMVFSHRGFDNGFSAEIEFDGNVHGFEYRKPCKQGDRIHIGKVLFDKKTNTFSMAESMDSTLSSKDIWGLKTNQFHPVSICMLSPNYWDNRGVGNKHWFFMLEGCKNPNKPSGFFNEFLPEDLNKHKKVFAALSSQMRVEDSNEQLSGLGFSSTKRASLTVKVAGSFTRMLKIMF